MKIIEDIKKALQEIKMSKKTIICPPSLESHVQEVVNKHDLSNIYSVKASTAVEPLQILIISDGEIAENFTAFIEEVKMPIDELNVSPLISYSMRVNPISGLV